MPTGSNSMPCTMRPAPTLLDLVASRKSASSTCNCSGTARPSLRPPQPAAHQHLARLDHFAADQRLQPVEIQLAVGVAIRRPAFEQGIDLAVQLVVAAGGTGHDARTDDVVHQHRHGLGRMRVVAHQIAHPVAQQRPGHADLGVGRGSRRAPAVRAPPLGRAIIAARQGLEGLPRQHAPGRHARGDRGDGMVHPVRGHQRSPRQKPANPAIGSGRVSARRWRVRWSGCGPADPRPSHSRPTCRHS